MRASRLSHPPEDYTLPAGTQLLLPPLTPSVPQKEEYEPETNLQSLITLYETYDELNVALAAELTYDTGTLYYIRPLRKT